jgi:hypothetical protein
MFYTIFKPEDFYKNFETDYFLFSQELNRSNLENKDLFNTIKQKFSWVEEESYRLSVLMQIRFQTLLCINTLFELIFNLLPDENGYIPDKELILRMNSFQELKPSEIAYWLNGEKSKLDKLLQPITYKNGDVKELIYHLFYFGQPKTDDLAKSVSNLVEMLKVMGKEISDTSEINSFKHGMRGVVDPRYFKILNKETEEDIMNFDFSESISFYSYHKKEKCFTINYRKLAQERDYNLTVYASLLLKAIVTPRKKSFHKNETKEEIINILISDENLEQVATTSEGQFHLKFSNCKKKQ